MAITPLHSFGWEKEAQLKPHLETFMAAPLNMTSWRYDGVDAYTLDNKWDIEIKSRRMYNNQGGFQDSTTYNEWVVPCCKVCFSKRDRFRIFYYWEGDNTLWYCDHSDIWDSFTQKVPEWHKEPHFFIPRHHFTQIVFPGLPQTEQRLCLNDTE